MQALLYELGEDAERMAQDALRDGPNVVHFGPAHLRDGIDVVIVEPERQTRLDFVCTELRGAMPCRDASILAMVPTASDASLRSILDAGVDDFFVFSLGPNALRQRLEIGARIAAGRTLKRQAETDRERFFELSLDMLCIAGMDGYFRRVNPSWTRALGWTPAELCERPWLDFIHPDDLQATLAAEAQLENGASVTTFSNRYRHKDGSYRWFEWRAVPYGDAERIYAAARDVTEQREAIEAQARAQKQLMAADRMASVGTLAAGVAHEINNPLTSIVANLEMIDDELIAMKRSLAPDRADELAEMIGDAKAGAERVRKIVRGLKTFSRFDDDRRSVIDVRQTIELSINMTGNEIRHRARLVKDLGPVPPVVADNTRLGQVLINLLVNAVQAIRDGRSEDNEIRVVTETDPSGDAVIEVRDTGIGIPAAIIDRIFEPFFTTKSIGEGTGLGLSICHNIVASLGGTITASSVDGRGSTFRIVLPRANAQPDAEPPSSRAEPSTCATKARVLIVDDEPIVGITLKRLLRDHDVTVTFRADDALELIGRGERFDVILSDVMMPEMSGKEFYEALVRSHPELPERVVFVTGGAFTPGAQTFLDSVPNERIAKPFDASTVREAVERFVGHARSR